MNNKSGFKLALANGYGWLLVASPELEEWMIWFASVMQLPYESSASGSPRLIFTSMHRPGSSLAGADDGGIFPADTLLHETGWAMREVHEIRIWTHPCETDVICELGSEKSKETDIFRMCMSLEPLYEAAVNLGGLPLHAALVERHGQGVLLVGDGGVGKSTCCRRLPAPWQAHCDDQVLILRDRRQRLVAHPFPTWSDYLWGKSGKTWQVSNHFPVAAIFFLKRAQIDSVTRLAQHEGAVLLASSSQQIFLDYGRKVYEMRLLRRNQLENACRLARELPVFILNASLTGQFWRTIERVLEKTE